MMRILVSAFILSCFLFIFSCSDEGSSIPDLQGEVENIPFTLGDAIFNDNGDNTLSFKVYDKAEVSTDLCSITPTEIFIFFDSENTLDQRDLFVDFSSFEGFNITAYNPQTMNNILFKEGWFRIIENNEDNIIAEMDISDDDNNFIRGGFTALRCN
ncbi:MAG: hypothetical protein HKN51_03025 [Saprospiraceae bacterium]|nr:hypothetical protein [Saprospiraceae bacterium]